MATRSTTHFTDRNDAVRAIIYRHWDGYPECAGVAILEFLDKVKANSPGDTRFSDPEYLAARYVAFLADQFSTHQVKTDNGEWVERRLPDLAFTSVGVCMEDPGDIEYRYTVKCGFSHDADGKIVEFPLVTVTNVYTNATHDLIAHLAAGASI